ncbi:hypothetical protein, partial [Nocardioides sp.]|uniref:hypothetical protein n=1 Tax=Nocardioides sp. TaxID=35761 RepID=UPI003564C9FD
MSRPGDRSSSDSAPDGVQKPDATKADIRQPDTKQPDTKPSVTTENPLRGSRTSGFWAAVVGFGVVLVLRIIF